MCGVVGVLGDYATEFAIRGLEGLQHRGQRGAGITSWWNFDVQKPHVREGSVAQAFLNLDMNRFPGNSAVAQVLYSTHEGDPNNGQPLHFLWKGKTVAVAHNGQITNLREIERITNRPYQDVTDTWAIADLVAHEKAPTFEEALAGAAKKLRGSFSCIFLYENKLYALKDRFGFHPLQLGVRGNDWCVASESSAFEMMNAELIRDIRPGELLVLENDTEPRSRMWCENPSLMLDIWELVYFASPISIIHGVAVNRVRYWLGRLLAMRFDATRIPHGTIIAPVPDSGNQCTRGFYEGLVFRGRTDLIYNPNALFRAHSSNERTYLKNTQQERERSVERKFRVCGTEVKDNWMVVVDDTIVRGTTSKNLVRKIIAAGAKGVIYAIPASPCAFADPYGGNDTHREPELLKARGCNGDINCIRSYIEASWLEYLPVDTMKMAVEIAGQETRTMVFVPSDQLSEELLTKGKLYCGTFDGVYPDGLGDFEYLAS